MSEFGFSHIESKQYSYFPVVSMPGWNSVYNTLGWTDHLLGDSIVYSHRKNNYTPANFLDQLSMHDYYELLIPVMGNAVYTIGEQYIPLVSGALMMVKPRCIHGCRMVSDSFYERYVFYFQESAFKAMGNDLSLLRFIEQTENCCLSLPVELESTMFNLLSRLDRCLAGKEPDTPMLAYSYIIQLFHLFNHHAVPFKADAQALPEIIVKIKQYVDENYLNINNISEIAKHFFYSREHISRLFKECFNTNLSDYLATLKIRHSKQLLEEGVAVTEACYQSGFRNMTTFATAFCGQMNMKPSEYRKAVREKKKEM